MRDDVQSSCAHQVRCVSLRVSLLRSDATTLLVVSVVVRVVVCQKGEKGDPPNPPSAHSSSRATNCRKRRLLGFYANV